MLIDALGPDVLDHPEERLLELEPFAEKTAFRKAFAEFEPHKIARFTADDVERLMQDAGIVRNRSKIVSTIASAKAWLTIQERGSFSAFLWDFVDGRPVQNNLRSLETIPTDSDASKKMSKALKQAGFNFCGPTITYAFMQAVGMVNDHFVGCFRHAECAALAEKL